MVNPAPQDDPASSLHLGLRTLDGDVHAVMVLLADQPLINAADIGAVLDAFQRRPPGAQVLLPMVHGVPGHPVVFDAAVRADLLAGTGTGLRQWCAAHPQATLPRLVDNPHHTRDLDTPEDVEALERETGWVCRWPEPAPGINTDPASA